MILIKIFHLLIGGAALISCASGRSAQRTDIPRKVNKGVYKTITKDTPKVSKHHLETKQRAADGRHPTGGNGNDFIILLKNSNPKNDIRNIMIVNTRDSVKLNHKSSALTRKQKSIDITTKPVTKRTTVKNATETVRYESPAMLRAKDTISTKPGALPNADILDMAPATGSRIIAKRLKICIIMHLRVKVCTKTCGRRTQLHLFALVVVK
ncbi:uncharacterized protein [Battus philenor]|uniref:uncharacterized protein n=1 Tax=Battus philenor TaxID=42288 RepID=UPI0035D0B735